MKNISKLLSVSVFAFALAACGGSSGGSESTGGSNNTNNNTGSSNSTNNDKINGLYKAFTTCEDASATSEHQTLINRLCGEREITFENTGNKGVLRVTGAPLNWNASGSMPDWKSFYVEILMEQDEGLGITMDYSDKYPYSMFLVYMNLQPTTTAHYSINKISDTLHALTITDTEEAWIGYSPVQVERVIHLDIQQASKPENDTISGYISIGSDTKINFTAKGKATQNQPLIQLK